MASWGAEPLRFAVEPQPRSVPIANPTTTAADVRAQLTRTRFDSAAHVVVCGTGGDLVGLVRIEDVLAAAPAAELHDLMDDDPPRVVVGESGVDEEIAAWKAVRHGESALAVVDERGRFVDLVPPRRVVEVLLSEHDEDLARLGGYLTSTSAARHATEESIGVRFGHRVPWLLLGLAGAIAAARVVEAFSDRLERDVLIAFFVPGVVYMADAVGTQTEAVVIRGLSVGVPIGRVFRRELITGLLIGVAIAAAFVPIGTALWGRADITVAVSVALLAACSTATAVAMALPWLFHRSGRDPAFGSGPLATVVQDMLSLVIYLAVASLIVG
jgi:magnesium transporter